MNKFLAYFWGLLYVGLSIIANVAMFYAVFNVFAWEAVFAFIGAYAISAYGAYKALTMPDIPITFRKGVST